MTALTSNLILEIIPEVFMKLFAPVLTFLILVFIGSLPTRAQAPEQPAPAAQTQENRFSGDPIRQLNLTPEQREQIRTIREQNREERAAINHRVREANRALEELLDSDNPDQSQVEKRMKDLSAAQLDSMRMRVLTEVKIRQVLTGEQRALLRDLRKHAQNVRRDRIMTGERQRRVEERSLRLRERRNRIRPLLRQREIQRQQSPTP
jgi:Spy/CpxP family protein refolding chaperone